MSEPLTDLEKYNRGLPLSDENAALMQGREPIAEQWARTDQRSNSTDAGQTISEDDREWLRRLTHEPGFPIFIRELNRAIQKREDGAKVLSSIDPVGQKDEVIKLWTYIAAMKLVMGDIAVLVKDSQSS